MQTALIVLHLVICITLIMIVLLQTGKGSEIGAVFGSSSQTLFGSTGGSTFFGKLTAAVAIVFMITSLVLASRSSRVPKESVMSGVKPAVTAPATTEGVTPIQPLEAEKNTQAEPSADVPTPEKQQTTPVAGEEKTE
ncbi:MAG: preprotein translocase subunit SecG [Deltaproteobacteria bacterium]|jgi:preprotein translocase subunit SecG|nr:preprotein translocase subunit SecG [Deltaproteobacteria bacterium]MDH3801913.1 preprotein translocase subunit SecG [Deltaproteobacteria bacterium]MDH3899031.1 preprotein translocase subunit SecG [Deltaproteobacteria bacterium]MDH3930352.1 preprotein translocase subunit SecG [Deltaproteobacteria bacterium]MDH3950497.1 preprotein translocase subunit SecG [Deltaproteobacteria bacterium]